VEGKQRVVSCRVVRYVRVWKEFVGVYGIYGSYPIICSMTLDKSARNFSLTTRDMQKTGIIFVKYRSVKPYHQCAE
jgi:hypothetical protein